jgi:hypothetical protein
VETKTTAGGTVVIRLGGKAKGEKYSRVMCDWTIVSDSPLLSEEMEKLIDQIATSSGTSVAAMFNAVPVAPIICNKCGSFNFGGNFCSNCGNRLEGEQNQKN